VGGAELRILIRAGFSKQEISRSQQLCKRQVEIEQLCVPVFFIRGFRGSWVGAGSMTHSRSLGQVAKLLATAGLYWSTVVVY